MNKAQKNSETASSHIKNSLPWIKQAPGDIPYFIAKDGTDFTPIGQNDAINWPDFNNLFKRKDLEQVENHLKWLKAHGITVLRFMMEYSQNNYSILRSLWVSFRRIWCSFGMIFFNYVRSTKCDC
ncbi:hypothetical protein LZ575_13425 [Antarcticibacterium sp. 1MA-6-2]|uniref:hypothetical protein n=1 Tax=Antarcticibacterium sp. 1MA-6-2 TaxID=2908210 RepID=UPI001F17FABA|nr:hypothetical protein [Antarcticibacterium sp. 1MA-6-2]UJH89958.1 hypothetical protein LZ575_13425 [Antarcticibacterium sp. 1MA-6-2]